MQFYVGYIEIYDFRVLISFARFVSYISKESGYITR